MARLVISQNERIMLHLAEFDRYRDEAEVPMGVCQEGISERLQTQVHNASRALASLQAEGLVFDRLSHVRGAPKRRRAYFLTEKGRQAAQTIRVDVGRRKVVLEDEGSAQELPIDDVMRRVARLTGQAPSFSEMLDLLRQEDTIRARDLKSRSRAPEEPAKFVERAHGRPKVESFFGREKELQKVEESLSAKEDSVMLLWGIPGIGKSTLGSKVFDQHSGKRSMFWYTFREWDTEGSFMSALVGFLGSAGRSETSEALKRGHVTADLFVPFVNDLANSDSVVFLDDVHKAAKQLGLLLSVLVDAAKASNSAKLVLMSRSIPPFFSKTSPGNIVTELTGLEREAAKQMVAGAKTPEVLRAVDESHGHPLLLRLMVSSGISQSKGDVVEFIEREVYLAASPEERSVLELLSIFRHPVGADAMGSIEYETVARLRQRALITEQEGGMSTHDLLKEFFSSRISADKKAELHRRAASYCENHPQVEWKLEALFHAAEAGDWPSARRMSDASARELAKEFPGEFLALLSRIPVDSGTKAERAGVMFIRGQLKEQLGDHPGAIKDYEDSSSMLAGEEDAAMRAAILEATAKLQAQVERWSESFSAHEKALELYEKSGDKDGQAREWMNIGAVHRKRGDYAKARESYSKALSLASLQENRSAQAACMNNLSLLDWDEGRMRDAEVRLKEAIKFAHIAKDHAGEAKGLENLAELYRTQFKTSEMTTLLWESSEAFRRAGEIEEFKRLQAACGESLGAQGRISDGIDLCRTALEKPELRRRKVLFQKGQRFDMGDFALSATLIDLLRRSGDFKGALRETSRLMSMADSLNSQTLLAKVKLELALTHESAGDLDASLKALTEAEGILRSEGDHEGLIAVHMRRGIIEEKRGDEVSAIKSYTEAIRHAETSGNDRARSLAEENIKALRSA